jgi:hypothetical protein
MNIDLVQWFLSGAILAGCGHTASWRGIGVMAMLYATLYATWSALAT